MSIGSVGSGFGYPLSSLGQSQAGSTPAPDAASPASISVSAQASPYTTASSDIDKEFMRLLLGLRTNDTAGDTSGSAATDSTALATALAPGENGSPSAAVDTGNSTGAAGTATAASGATAASTASTSDSGGTSQEKSIDDLVSELSSLLGNTGSTQMTAYQYNALFGTGGHTASTGTAYTQSV